MDIKFFNASEKRIDLEKRTVRVLASDDSLDRDGERVLPSAFKKHLGAYKKNPVVLACHQHTWADGTPPVIGRCTSIWIDKAGLWAIIKFGTSELAEQYWNLYADGTMTAVSVGFGVLKSEQRYDSEAGQTVTVITEAELYEISLVAVPSNRSAGVKSFVEKKKAEKQFAALDYHQRRDLVCAVIEKTNRICPAIFYEQLPPEKFGNKFSSLEVAAIKHVQADAAEFARIFFDEDLGGGEYLADGPGYPDELYEQGDDPIFGNLVDESGKSVEPDYAAFFI